MGVFTPRWFEQRSRRAHATKGFNLVLVIPKGTRPRLRPHMKMNERTPQLYVAQALILTGHAKGASFVEPGSMGSGRFRGAATLLSKSLPTIFVLALAASSAPAQFVLNPIPGLEGVHSGSLAWADYDNDGRLDFVLTGSFEPSLNTSLWRNTGSGF